MADLSLDEAENDRAHGVVAVTEAIPLDRVRLRVSGSIRGAAAQDVPARLVRLAANYPSILCMVGVRLAKLRVAPSTSIERDLDADDATIPGPCPTRDLHCATPDRRSVDRGCDDRFHSHPRYGSRGPPLLLVDVALTLEVSPEGLRQGGDPGDPLHACHSVPAWNDQAQRGAVRFTDRLAVHLEREQHIIAHRLGDRECVSVGFCG